MASTPTAPSPLSGAVAELAAALRASAPRAPACITTAEYECPPHVRKARWTALGDEVRKAEELAVARVPGDRWISLRLDGCGFGKFVRACRAQGLFPPRGYAEEFAHLMQTGCAALAGKFHAFVAYTQSDEMTLLIPPAPVSAAGEQGPHVFNGRVMKLCSVAASHLTVVFAKEVLKLARDKQIEVDLAPVFDCRLGSFASLDEALALILWRAYDSGVNGVSDACHHQRGALDGAKQAVGLPTSEKLVWLHAHGLLPLKSHQAHGTFFTRVRRRRKRPENAEWKQKADASPWYLRRVLEQKSVNVLAAFAKGTLIPDDESLETSPLVSEDCT